MFFFFFFLFFFCSADRFKAVPLLQVLLINKSVTEIVLFYFVIVYSSLLLPAL